MERTDSLGTPKEPSTSACGVCLEDSVNPTVVIRKNEEWKRKNAPFWVNNCRNAPFQKLIAEMPTSISKLQKYPLQKTIAEMPPVVKLIAQMPPAQQDDTKASNHPRLRSSRQSKRHEWQHDKYHDTAFDELIELSLKKWHDMTGDPSPAETCRVGSGRPWRGCFRGLWAGRERIAPVAKTGTNGLVNLCAIQWLWGARNEGCIENESCENGSYRQRYALCRVSSVLHHLSCTTEKVRWVMEKNRWLFAQ